MVGHDFQGFGKSEGARPWAGGSGSGAIANGREQDIQQDVVFLFPRLSHSRCCEQFVGNAFQVSRTTFRADAHGSMGRQKPSGELLTESLRGRFKTSDFCR